MISDVLVFTPVYRLEPETVSAIFSLEWEGPLSFLLQRDNPHKFKENGMADGRRNHLHQYQRGQELFLKGPYDAMLVIESDIIPPKDTLKRLSALDVDLAYGCYLFQGSGIVNLMERYPGEARNMGESLTVRGLWQAAKEAGIVKVSGSGLGCLLIKRHVLEETPFEFPANQRETGSHFDWPWTMEAYQKGYTMVGDTALLCGHKWVSGRTVWPP